MVTGTVKELWRYPVKSLGGEALQAAQVLERSVRGDRNWAIYDPIAPKIRNAKQWAKLLELRSEYRWEPGPDDYGDAVATVRLYAPDGSYCDSDNLEACAAWLTDFLEAPAQLKPRAPASDRSFYALPKARTEAEIRSELGLATDDPLPDFSAIDADVMSILQYHVTPPGYLYDAFPVHVLTTDSLAFLEEKSGLDTDVRRFRPNILVEMDEPAVEPTEQSWLGGSIVVGETELYVDSPTARCSMPRDAQPQFGVTEQRRMSAALVRHVRMDFGINTKVLMPGTINVGDTIRVLPSNTGD